VRLLEAPPWILRCLTSYFGTRTEPRGVEIQSPPQSRTAAG
jgi:hypothetical protein